MDESSRNVSRVCSNLGVSHFERAVVKARDGVLNREIVTDLYATLSDATEWTKRWLEDHPE